MQIWNHPDLLLLAQEEKDLRKEDDVENFTVDIDDDVPDVVEVPNGDPDGGVIILNGNADVGGGEEIPKGGLNLLKSFTLNNLSLLYHLLLNSVLLPARFCVYFAHLQRICVDACKVYVKKDIHER